MGSSHACLLLRGTNNVNFMQGEQGLKATERTILTPKINLDVGTLVLDKSQSGNNSGYIDLFPSIHDPCKDGTVRLLHIAN